VRKRIQAGEVRGLTRTLIHRFAELPGDRIEDELVLKQGDWGHYDQLCGYHYRAARPATASRVLVLEHYRQSVSGRYLGQPVENQVVAVLVESWPCLHCRSRDWVLGQRYRKIKDLRGRALMLNQELRCISRVIVHPSWRGIGLGVRLVRAALAEPATVYTEALAAMGHVHRFFERAGMTAYQQEPHEHDARFEAALKAVGLNAIDLARVDQMIKRIETLPVAKQRWLMAELGRWHQQVLGRSNHCSTDLVEQLRTAQQRLLCKPVYFLKDNRGQLEGEVRYGGE